jgi:hypothetical protein
MDSGQGRNGYAAEEALPFAERFHPLFISQRYMDNSAISGIHRSARKRFALLLGFLGKSPGQGTQLLSRPFPITIRI